MSDTVTPNLGLTLPTVGADSDAWGGILNTDLTILDGFMGTSGHKIPFLDETNTFSGVQQNFGAIQTTGNVGIGVTAAQRLDVGEESRFAVDVTTSALKVSLRAIGFDAAEVVSVETDASDHAWLIDAVPKMTLSAGGDLNVVGTLSKGAGSFKIEHPLPALKDSHWLVHSFVEGPRADLIYRGRTKLSGGRASVDLDEAAGMTAGTWAVLCRDPQVFVANESGWTCVRGRVSGAVLSIEAPTDACNDTVSWLVIAERQDPTIRQSPMCDAEGRVIVEPARAEAE